jgi:hypothetical protein
VAVVLTLVQAKQIRINIHKRNNKTPTHYKTHTYTHTHITKEVKTTKVQDTHKMKLSQYIQVPSVGHPNVHGTFVPKKFTVSHFT